MQLTHLHILLNMNRYAPFKLAVTPDNYFFLFLLDAGPSSILDPKSDDDGCESPCNKAISIVSGICSTVRNVEKNI